MLELKCCYEDLRKMFRYFESLSTRIQIGKLVNACIKIAEVNLVKNGRWGGKEESESDCIRI